MSFMERIGWMLGGYFSVILLMGLTAGLFLLLAKLTRR